MDDFKDKLNAIDKNLFDLNYMAAGLQECRLAHIREKAKLLLDQYKGGDMFFTNDAFRELYREVTGDLKKSFIDGVIPENLTALSYTYENVMNMEKIYLCHSIIEFYNEMNGTEISAAEYFTETAPGADSNRIAYLRNSYTDTAYSIFSRELDDATVTYCVDFNGVCEDVYYGRANLCILPVENSSDGKLISFRNLIKKYDLKITLMCSVDTSHSNYTKFALLKKNIEKIKIKSVNMKTQNFFELSVTLAKPSELTAILLAAEFYKLKLYKIDSTPLTYSDNEYSYDVIFITDSGKIQNFICYLFLEIPQFTPVGLYAYLKK